VPRSPFSRNVRPNSEITTTNGIAPSRRSDLFRKTGKRATEFAETVGEITRRRALVDMGVPAADIGQSRD